MPGSKSGFDWCQQGFIKTSPINIEPAKTALRLGKLVPNPKTRLREQFHEVARFKYFSQRAEDSYWHWVVRNLKFHRDHPHLTLVTDAGSPYGPEVDLFLRLALNNSIWASLKKS